MSWLITPQLKVLNGVPQESILGIPFGGGYFAGYISHTANGNPTHALIVAPRATGATGTGYTQTTSLRWKTTQTDTTGTASTFDGVSNTSAITAAGINDHPAAKFCTDLTIGGFADWYLPSRLELDIAYFNLKPTTASNNISFPAGGNAYSVPKRVTSNSASYPAQTAVADFTTTAERFEPINHWSSTTSNATQANNAIFSTGWNPANNNKDSLLAVRAFRRIAL